MVPVPRRVRAAVLALAFIPTIGTAFAQPAGKVSRVGVLSSGASFPDPFRNAMRELGYVEGANLAVEWRDAEGKTERFDGLAAELVRLNVDVIVAAVPGATLAARKATASIPIVMVNTPDPVQLGLARSLGRPGGNITGTTTLSAELSVKQLELLKEMVPRAVRVGVLWNPDNPWHSFALKGVGAAARSLGVELQVLPVRRGEDFERAFTTMARRRAEAMLALADPLSHFHRARLANLAVERRLPAMYGTRSYAEAGGLMSFWAHQGDLTRRVASYVDRILKGATPGDLPIEQPTRFELVINLKTAKTMGLAIPPALLARADHVIR
jgi:putative ABC transport system substrate-binding protein